ncbi:hypothetical protein L198_05424 [Cryptococcus wingfieldii CBS 7118]|uniref:Uncharacterized protein n=1 Tax=Cryptococcus wingfieldii CBS 7118 TaxID=1295528 RepID=A0A1E3IYD3_9TREE|nr:hypothetical protein L198_05424 [Cryptococcus wingfieldii CBS 7118]ODN93558.1 hypothetical protein L198_05424 [Cryptococcus wingfieldii CBS 7118]
MILLSSHLTEAGVVDTKSKDDIPFPAPSAFTNPWRKPSLRPPSPSHNPPPNPAPGPTDSPALSSWRSFLNIHDTNTSPPLTPAPTSSPVLLPTSSSAAAGGYEVLSIPALGRRLTEAEENGHLECLGAQRGCWKMPWAMRAGAKDKEEEGKEGKGDGEDGGDGEDDDSPFEEKDDPFSSVPLERGALGSLGVSGDGYEDHDQDEAEEPRSRAQFQPGCGSESGSGSESEEAESEAEYEKDNDNKDNVKDKSKEEEEDDEAEELFNFAPRRPPLTPKVSSFNHTNRYRFFGHINCPAFPRPPPASPRKTKTVMVPGKPLPERAWSVPTMPGAGGYGTKVPSKLSGSVMAGGEPIPTPNPNPNPNPDRPQPFPQPTPHPPGPRRSNTFSIAPCYNGLKQGYGARTQIIQNKADDETGLAFGMLKVVEQRREWAPVKQPERWVLRGEFKTESRVPTLASLKKESGHGHGHGQHGQHEHHHEHEKKLVEGQS